MDKKFGILDLLKLSGLDSSQPIMFARHQSSEYDVEELLREGWLDTYQAFQSKSVFDNYEFVVAFVGTSGTKARLVGVYRVLEKRSADAAPLPTGFPYKEWQQDSKYFYRLEQQSGFEHLKHRVVIEWGKGTIKWAQNAKNKEVLEILPSGQVREPFKDYLEFDLTHDELVGIISHPEAHREWYASLSAVAGVYLILATKSGQQYVGSASGDGGVWERWASYAKNGHGGNKLLKDLVESDSAYPLAFRYTLLHILPKTFTKKEVLQWESHYKRKLGTLATGLNLN